MATREEIYTAIRNADKAGDSAAVRKLGAYLQTLPAEEAAKPLNASSTHEMAVKAAPEPSIAMAPVGAAELLAKGVTGAVASIPAGLAYGGAAIGKAFGADVNPADVQRRTQNYFTYQPVSDSAKAAEKDLSTTYSPAIKAVGNAADQAATAVGKISPTAETLLREAPAAAQAAGAVVPFVTPALAVARQVPSAVASGARATASGVAAAGRKVAQAGEAVSDASVRALGGQVRPSANPVAPISAQAIIDRQAANSGQSMGAAAAAPRVTGASPELQQAISKTAQQTGGAINPEILSRHLEADSLPVKVRLTEGQATQDPAAISHEQNLRGKHTELANHFDEQNKQLAANVQAIRDQVGPDVFSTNHVEHGDTLIDAYKQIDKAAKDDIKAKYQALNDASGGKFPIDGQTFVAGADQALAKQMKGRYVPSEIKGDLADIREGKPMTFETFENLRTNLAAEARKAERSGDGNAMAAVNIVREQLESLPMTGETAQIKPLADAARSAAKARFDALRADPAYKAAVYETVDPDKFAKRFVVNGSRDDVATMARNLQGSDTARQTMAVSVLDHLRDQAGLTSDYKGNFTQAGYNKALRGLDPKLQSLVDTKTAEQLQTLGNVANYTQFQPRGSFVNNSNTFVAGAADYGAGALEGAANVAAHGVPIGTWGRKAIARVQAGKQVRAAIAPGAGIGRLSDLSPGRQTKGAVPLSSLPRPNAPR